MSAGEQTGRSMHLATRLGKTCWSDRRQVGVELHELQPALPLFDGVTGEAVPQAVDTRVERLRDALMDDARERVDDLGEDLVVGVSLFFLQC